MWLAIQAVVAIGLAAFSVFQAEPDWSSGLIDIGTTDRWTSCLIYAVYALACIVLMLVPSLRMRLIGWFPQKLQPLLPALGSMTGISVLAMMGLHAAGGNAWFSAESTPFVHTSTLGYLLGGLALVLLSLLLLLLVFGGGSRPLRNCPRCLEVWRSCALVAGTLFIMFALAETGLRLYAVINPQTDGASATPGSRMWKARYVRFNKAGFRDVELTPKQAGEFRVAVLGDSYVYGQGIRDPDDRCTGVLQQRLNESSADEPGSEEFFRVMNVARGGAHTERQLEWTDEYVIPAQPDFVILAYTWNDILHVARDEAFTSKRNNKAAAEAAELTWGTAKTWILTQSAVGGSLLRLRTQIRYGFAAQREPGGPTGMGPLQSLYRTPRAYRLHLDTIAELANRLDQHDIPFAVLIQPAWESSLDPDRYGRRLIGARMIRDLERRGVAAYDLLTLIPPPSLTGQDYWVNPSDPHPNQMGHRYIAEGMLTIMQEQLANRD